MKPGALAPLFRAASVPRPMPVRSAALSLALLLFTCASGCTSGEDDAPLPARVLDLAPEVIDAASIPLEETLYSRLEPPRSLAPWEIAADRIEVGPLPGFEAAGTDALMLWGQGEKRILIPGTFDPAAFDQAVFTIILRTSARVRVHLVRGGARVLSAKPLAVEQADVPQRLVALFARNALEREPFDAIEIVFPPGLGGPVCVLSAELVHRPFAAWVLEGGTAPRLVAIGNEYRSAQGLGGPIVRAARFRAPRGARLELSCALEPELRLPGLTPVLRASLAAEGLPVRVEELALERGTGGKVRWHSARIALEGLAEREVELRLELAGGEEREAYGYVGELRVVRELERPRTVLLVTSDTHRADHLGAAAEGGLVETPALDALAARGVLFERSQSTTNITLPSHAALMTGVHPRDTRIVDNLTPLAEEAPTLAEAFRARGFRTFAAVSAGHLAPERSGLGQGFERVSVPGASLRDAEETVGDVERWMADAQGEELFVWLHLFDAHTPYDPPAELARRYLAGPHELATDGAGLAPLDESVQRERARYKGEVTYLDRELGRLLALDRFRDGVVAVTADHGECLGQHEVFYDHAELYPDTVRVPLILAWPGARAGSRVKLPTQHLVLGRTLLELAGLADVPFPGTSLLRRLEADARDEPLFALAYAGESASITHEGLHLILHLAAHEIDKGGQVIRRERHELELYDLARDQACERNLVEEREEDARRLRRALVDWLVQASPEGFAAPPSSDPAFLAELQKLGYVEGASRAGEAWIDAECACERCRPLR